MFTQASLPDFNTSHVSINPFWNLLPGGATLISIHLMFLLIAIPVFIQSLKNCDFNTSHVSINPAAPALQPTFHRHFNTSHVSINRFLSFANNFYTVHFNTSHVSINLSFSSTAASTASISIHLMFLLIRS